MIKKFLMALCLVISSTANAQNGFSVGLYGSYNFPLGRFSEVKLAPPSPMAGEDLATDGFGFGGIIKYQFPFLYNYLAIGGSVEYLEMDDKSMELIVTDEFGMPLGKTDYKFRIIPFILYVQYHPFSVLSRINPYAGFGLGAHYYSRVNAGDPLNTRIDSGLKEYVRFGLNFNLGSEFLIYRHWSLDVNVSHNIIFLREGDQVLYQGYMANLQYFQIKAGILYNFKSL